MKFIFPILFVLISILIFIFGVNPIYKDVSLLRSGIATYNQALGNSAELQNKQDVLLKAYNEIKQEDKNRLKSLLPDSVNNIGLIIEIERIAIIHGMPIKDIKFEAKKKDGAPIDPNVIVAETAVDNRPYGVFPIEFSTDGKYDNFVLFLKDLEYNLRLVDVKSVSFSVPDATKVIEAGDPNIYHYTLKIETYWLK